MWTHLGAILVLLVAVANASRKPKVLCYYDGSGSLLENLGKVTPTDIEPALPYCTHLIYGYAGLNAQTHKIRTLNEELDLDSGKGQYRQITALKRRYPGLKVLLSIGGNKDLTEEKPFEKYLAMLENGGSRTAFVDSVHELLKTYEFDGLDMAWQFPQTKPKRIRGWTGKLWHGFKKLFTGDRVLDPKADEHKEEFTALVRDLKSAFLHEKYLLGLTVLPHVNESLFLDIPLLKDNLEYVNLAAFDQQTPERNPKEGDYTAPTYEPNELWVTNMRVVGNNIDAKVNYWLAQGTPTEKIIVGIPAYGRGWKLNEDSGITGDPPIPANGPSFPSQYTGVPGFYGWAEVCALLRTLSKTAKPFGVYVFRLPDENNEHGVWISYEDPYTSGNKAAYVKSKGLGGISIFELGYDDVRGTCGDDDFPILRAAKYRL